MYEALQFAEALATQSDGLRLLGAPGWQHAKLIYDVSPGKEGKYFFINANGMDEKQFQKWQLFIGGKI